MRFLYLILLFVTFSSYSQDKSIEILLETDRIITTEWIELHEFPFFKNPYIIIHSIDGPKIEIADIKHYKGNDQFGNYRQLDVIGLGKKREYCFIERKFKLDSTERVKIFYDQFIYGLDENSGKVKNVKYSINNYQIRKLNYRNLKNDMIDIGISTNKLKKVNQLRIVQYISIGLGAALLTDVIIRNREPRDAEFMNAKSSLKLIASGLLFTFPLTLEKPKQDRLVKTLRDLD